MSALGDAYRMIGAGFCALADALDATAGPDNPPDELLDVAATLEQHRVGRRALLAAVDRGELTVSRGARRKLLVARSELERWLRSRPVRPRERRSGDVVDLATYERDALTQLSRARRSIG